MDHTRAIPLCLPANCRWNQEHQELVFDTTAERGDLVLCQEGLKVLRSINKPVVVICITGPARSGKSFFLSQISNGVRFEVGHGTTAKTTGIWIASTDVQKGGQKTTAVLLDTEGICSVSTMDNNTDAAWDKKLFTLSLLLSSYFIFNCQGTPTFRDLDKLAFVGKLTEHLKSSRPSARDQNANVLASSPDFLWLVRDAHLQPEVQGERCGWSRYLKESVLKSHSHRRSDPTNVIRKAVVKTFGKIDAYGLSFPSVDPNVIQKLGSPEGATMTQPAFRESIRSVKRKIFSVAKEKTINGRILSGKDLADFAEIFVEQLNSESGIIDVESTWACLLAVEKAEAVYNNEMTSVQEKLLPCSCSEMRKFHNDAKKKAEYTLSARSHLSSKFVKEIHTRKFDLNVESRFELYQSRNQRLSHDQCQKLRNNLFLLYMQPMFDDPSKFQVKNIQVKKDKVLEDYDLKARGPERDKIRLGMVREMARKTLEIEKLIMHEAIKKALHLYEVEMVSLQLPCETSRLNAKHMKALNVAMKAFEEICSGAETKFLTDCKQRLKEDIRDKMSSFLENNDCLSIEKCQKIMDNLLKQHLYPLLNDLEHNSYKTLTQAEQVILENYDSIAIGPGVERVRGKGKREIKERLKESQVQIAQATVRRAVIIYDSHMQNMTLPCSENRLYRRDGQAREQAFEKFKTDLDNFPASVVETHERKLRWNLDRNFSVFKRENYSQSRRQYQRLVKNLEEEHRLHHVLKDPRLRSDSTVKEKVEKIKQEYKWTASISNGPAADEIQVEMETEYNKILRQCKRESADQAAAVAAGLVIAGGLAIWGLSKLFDKKDSKGKR